MECPTCCKTCPCNCCDKMEGVVKGPKTEQLAWITDKTIENIGCCAQPKSQKEAISSIWDVSETRRTRCGKYTPPVVTTCTSNWSLIANENDEIFFNVPVDVRYGVDPNYVYENNIIGNFQFVTSNFSSDPSPGQRKQGWYRCPTLSFSDQLTGWQVVFENHFENMIPSTEPNVLINALVTPTVPAVLQLQKTFLTPDRVGQATYINLPTCFDGKYTVTAITINNAPYTAGTQVTLLASNFMNMVFNRNTGSNVKLKVLIN